MAAPDPLPAPATLRSPHFHVSLPVSRSPRALSVPQVQPRQGFPQAPLSSAPFCSHHPDLISPVPLDFKYTKGMLQAEEPSLHSSSSTQQQASQMPFEWF